MAAAGVGTGLETSPATAAPGNEAGLPLAACCECSKSTLQQPGVAHVPLTCLCPHLLCAKCIQAHHRNSLVNGVHSGRQSLKLDACPACEASITDEDDLVATELLRRTLPPPSSQISADDTALERRSWTDASVAFVSMLYHRCFYPASAAVGLFLVTSLCTDQEQLLLVNAAWEILMTLFCTLPLLAAADALTASTRFLTKLYGDNSLTKSLEKLYGYTAEHVRREDAARPVNASGIKEKTSNFYIVVAILAFLGFLMQTQAAFPLLVPLGMLLRPVSFFLATLLLLIALGFAVSYELGVLEMNMSEERKKAKEVLPFLGGLLCVLGGVGCLSGLMAYVPLRSASFWIYCLDAFRHVAMQVFLCLRMSKAIVMSKEELDARIKQVSVLHGISKEMEKDFRKHPRALLILRKTLYCLWLLAPIILFFACMRDLVTSPARTHMDTALLLAERAQAQALQQVANGRASSGSTAIAEMSGAVLSTGLHFESWAEGVGFCCRLLAVIASPPLLIRSIPLLAAMAPSHLHMPLQYLPERVMSNLDLGMQKGADWCNGVLQQLHDCSSSVQSLQPPLKAAMASLKSSEIALKLEEEKARKKRAAAAAGGAGGPATSSSSSSSSGSGTTSGEDAHAAAAVAEAETSASSVEREEADDTTGGEHSSVSGSSSSSDKKEKKGFSLIFPMPKAVQKMRRPLRTLFLRSNRYLLLLASLLLSCCSGYFSLWAAVVGRLERALHWCWDPTPLAWEQRSSSSSSASSSSSGGQQTLSWEERLLHYATHLSSLLILFAFIGVLLSNVMRGPNAVPKGFWQHCIKCMTVTLPFVVMLSAAILPALKMVMNKKPKEE